MPFTLGTFLYFQQEPRYSLKALLFAPGWLYLEFMENLKEVWVLIKKKFWPENPRMGTSMFLLTVAIISCVSFFDPEISSSTSDRILSLAVGFFTFLWVYDRTRRNFKHMEEAKRVPKTTFTILIGFFAVASFSISFDPTQNKNLTDTGGSIALAISCLAWMALRIYKAKVMRAAAAAQEK